MNTKLCEAIMQGNHNATCDLRTNPILIYWVQVLCYCPIAQLMKLNPALSNEVNMPRHQLPAVIKFTMCSSTLFVVPQSQLIASFPVPLAGHFDTCLSHLCVEQ